MKTLLEFRKAAVVAVGEVSDEMTKIDKISQEKVIAAVAHGNVLQRERNRVMAIWKCIFHS
ncbi:MAG: hypothetical protein ABJA70_21820 [Chryseolinea sp.]